MLTEEKAQELILKFIDLRDKCKGSTDPNLIAEFKKHEEKCIEQYKYMITMRTSRYKAFSNYDDLNQEGLLALVNAMKNYNPKKGNVFYWIHRYVDTKIARSANLHTTIRYPLKVAKETAPHKELKMPNLIETKQCPDIQYENAEVSYFIEKAMTHLTDEQKNILNLIYGFDGAKPMSINKACKKLNVSRSYLVKNLNASMSLLKNNIKL